MPKETSLDSREADPNAIAAPEVFGWLCDNALHKLSLSSDRALRTDSLSQAEVESAWRLAWLALDLASAPANALPEVEGHAEITWPAELMDVLHTHPRVPKLPAAAWQQLRHARAPKLSLRLPERHSWSTGVAFRSATSLARELADTFMERELAALAACMTEELVLQLAEVLYACASLLVRLRANNAGPALEAIDALPKILGLLEPRFIADRLPPLGEQRSRPPAKLRPSELHSVVGLPPEAGLGAAPAAALSDSGPLIIERGAATSQPRAHLPAAVSGGDDVQFTVFRPNQLAPERWSKLLAFAHLAQRRPDAPPGTPEPLQQVQQQAQALLGAEIAKYRQLSEDAGQPIPFEGQLTFIPEVPDVKFDPPRASVLWVDDVQHVEFRIRPEAALVDSTARGRLSVFCGSILVADLQLSLPVAASLSSTSQTFAPPETGRMYRKIFASYSHKDASIVEQFRELAKAFGDRYLMDVSDLRAGERWSEALERLIREADVFQLFWSWSSIRSEFVRREWEYALQLGRESFVRPTYWEQPMPELPSEGLPPPKLAALQFQPLSLLSKSTPAPAYTAPRDDVGIELDERASPAVAPSSRELPAHRSSWLRRVLPLSSFVALGAALLFVMNTLHAPSRRETTIHDAPKQTAAERPIGTDAIKQPSIEVLPATPAPTQVPPADVADPEPTPSQERRSKSERHKASQPYTMRFRNAAAAKRAFEAKEIDEREYAEALKELEAERVSKPKKAPVSRDF